MLSKMRSWRARLRVPAVLSLLALSCSSGQTGSPRCDGRESCLCNALQAKLMFTGTLATFENGTATVLVTEWVSPVGYRDDLVLGDVVGGAVATTLGCGDPAVPEPSVGDEVFVVYARGGADRYPDCTEYQTCSITECGPAPDAEDAFPAWDVCDGQCVTETSAACSLRRADALLGGELVVLPRTQSQLLAGEQLTEAEIAPLYDRSICESRFPPAAKPCGDDTIDASSCALSPCAPRSAFGLVALGLLATATWVRRRRQKAGRRGERQQRPG